jgi:hypothetical protein
MPIRKIVSLFILVVLLAGTGSGSGSQSPSSGSTTLPTSPAPGFNGINLAYAPEGRYGDDNCSTTTPAACNPQLAFTTCPPNILSSCAANCQPCYNSDLATISSAKVSTITIYRPNYYILKAADNSGIRVVLGLYDDSVSGLAQPNTTKLHIRGPALSVLRHQVRTRAGKWDLWQREPEGAGNLPRIQPDEP